MECNHLSYMPFDISVTPLDVSMSNIGFPFFLEGVLELFTTVKGMMKVYEGIVKDYDTNPCFKILSKQIAVVKVKVLSNTVNKIIRSQRVTITGQIANIGKTKQSLHTL